MSGESLLEQRTAAAEELLRDALRVEIAAFVGRQLEDRLRARPNFFGRVPQVALVQMRAEIERLVPSLLSRAEQPLRDLRAFLGATTRDDAEERQALANTLRFVEDAARELLTTWCFPGDTKPDRPDEGGIDLDAEYRVAFAPSSNLAWAWRRLRGLDTARNQLADAEGRPVQPTAEMRLYLPEALPETNR